jgi:hypothetical protein
VEEPKTIGRYEIVERVGRGGMGVLYRARDAVLEREVAIKVMLGDFSGDEEGRARFYREARAAARLQHRYIVTIYEFGEEDGMPYLVMEFLRGSDLLRRMRADPPLTTDQKLDVVLQLCTALQFAHSQGVVHRDVKPANVWLLEDGNIKLLDFGIAKMAASTITQHAGVMGTISYMAPEVVGGKAADGRSDVFSAGVVLYELLSGHKPFEADSPTSLLLKILEGEPRPILDFVPGLPRILVQTVHLALEKNPDVRYQRAADFAADLQTARQALSPAGDASISLMDEPTIVNVREPEKPRAAPQSPIAQQEEVQPSTTAPSARPAWMMWAALAVVAVGVVIALFLGLRGRAPSGETVADAQRQAAEVPGGTKQAEPLTVAASKEAPAAPAPAVLPAFLRVVSDPAGAAIAVDGKDSGLSTPADVAIGQVPPARLSFQLDGFHPHESRVTKEELARGRLDVRLNPLPVPVKVRLTGGYRFEVVNEAGAVLSSYAERHDIVVTGKQRIRIRSAEYFLDRSFDLDGSRRSVELQAPQLGRLSVRSANETCTVRIGGRDLGFPPILGQSIVAGTHVVTLVCPDGKTQRESVTITAGQDQMVRIR